MDQENNVMPEITVDYRLPESDLNIIASIPFDADNESDLGMKIKIHLPEFKTTAVLSSRPQLYIFTAQAGKNKLPIWFIKVLWEISSSFGAHYDNIKALVQYKASSANMIALSNEKTGVS